MTRRSRSRFPGVAKLASGVVVGGVGLGLLISLTVDSEMKRPADSARLLSDRPEPAYRAQGETWLNAGGGQPAVPGNYRPDLDYDEVAGSEWAFDGGIELPPLPPIEEAVEATRAAEAAVAATREAVAPSASRPASHTRKSNLAQGGLY